MAQEGIFGTKLPCTASHEGAGTVAAIGSEVKDYQEGDRVMCGLWRDLCGKCEDCQPGRDNWRQYCPNHGGAIGINIHGAFADYVVVDSRSACKLPDQVSFETAAPLACAGCTIWRGIIQSGVKKGEWLAIVGSGGGLGHLGLRFAKALGIKTIAIDARDAGLELSKTAGADHVVDARPGDEKLIKEIEHITGGVRAKATVNVSDAPTAAATACAATKMHGVMVQIAQVYVSLFILQSQLTLAQPENVSVPFSELVFRDVRIHGSLVCSPQEAREMLDLVAEHNISVETNAFNGLRELPELIELVHGGKMQGKGIIIVDEEQIKREKELVSKQV
jgi:propanol-preferring alcohol dehydrogenase